MKCSKAGCGLPGQGSFCQSCGSKMVYDTPAKTTIICSGKLNGQPCGAEIVPSQNFCIKCGAKVDQDLFTVLLEACTRCGTVLSPECIFCANCGLQKSEKAFIKMHDAISQDNVEDGNQNDIDGSVPVAVASDSQQQHHSNTHSYKSTNIEQPLQSKCVSIVQNTIANTEIASVHSKQSGFMVETALVNMSSDTYSQTSAPESKNEQLEGATKELKDKKPEKTDTALKDKSGDENDEIEQLESRKNETDTSASSKTVAADVVIATCLELEDTTTDQAESGQKDATTQENVKSEKQNDIDDSVPAIVAADSQQQHDSNTHSYRSTNTEQPPQSCVSIVLNTNADTEIACVHGEHSGIVDETASENQSSDNGDTYSNTSATEFKNEQLEGATKKLKDKKPEKTDTTLKDKNCDEIEQLVSRNGEHDSSASSNIVAADAVKETCSELKDKTTDQAESGLKVCAVKETKDENGNLSQTDEIMIGAEVSTEQKKEQKEENETLSSDDQGLQLCRNETLEYIDNSAVRSDGGETNVESIHIDKKHPSSGGRKGQGTRKRNRKKESQRDKNDMKSLQKENIALGQNQGHTSNTATDTDVQEEENTEQVSEIHTHDSNTNNSREQFVFGNEGNKCVSENRYSSDIDSSVTLSPELPQPSFFHNEGEQHAIQQQDNGVSDRVDVKSSPKLT